MASSEKTSGNYWMFIKGCLISGFIVLFIFGLSVIFSSSEQSEKQGMSGEYLFGDQIDMPLLEFDMPVRQDQDTGSADKQGVAVPETGTPNSRDSLSGSGGSAVSDFALKALEMTSEINMAYLKLKQDVENLRQSSLFEKMKSVSGVKTQVLDQLDDEKGLRQDLSGMNKSKIKTDKEQELYDLLVELNALHIQILETGHARLENLDEKYDDIEQWDSRAGIIYNKVRLLFKDLAE